MERTPPTLPHARGWITTSTYPDEIEEAADNAIRKARVNALLGATKMAARMAAAGCASVQETATTRAAELITHPVVGDSSQQAASA